MGIILPVCTKVCPKGSAISYSVKSGDFTFCVCAVSWNANYDGPGYVRLDAKEQMDFINNNIGYKSLWFDCGDPGRTVFKQTPSWDVEASIGFDEYVLANAISVADKWQVGFIQTVESLEWEALYADGWGRQAVVGHARDAATASVTAPWFADPAPGVKGAPVMLNVAPNMHPTLADEPMVQLPVAHPDDDAWCKQITQVSVKGKFHLWLVAWDTRQSLAESALVFLYYSAIDMDKKWVLTAGSDPFDLSKWTATGKQTRSAVTFGKGSVSPVLATPVANPGLTFATHKKGTKCPKKPAASAKP